MEINEFLLARLEEIEAAAKAATAGPWSAADEHGLIEGAEPAWCVSRMRPGFESMSETEGYLCDIAYTAGTNEKLDAEHISQHDPAYVLADVASKRLLINYLDFNIDTVPLLDLLAAPFSDHPDYEANWAVRSGLLG